MCNIADRNVKRIKRCIQTPLKYLTWSILEKKDNIENLLTTVKS